VKLLQGELDVAIERFTRAMRLSPNDPQTFSMLEGIAAAHLVAGRYDEALSFAKASIQEKSTNIPAKPIAIASATLGGQHTEAKKAVAHLLQLDGSARVKNLMNLLVEFQQPEVLSRFAEGLRIAGLPE
jgi:tetratricopeptide (TPR) repeat protein